MGGERGCEEAIANAWTLNSAASLDDKIKHCRSNLTAWSKDYFGNFRHKLAVKRRELKLLQNLLILLTHCMR